MSRDKEIFETITSDTLRRAEEMCSSLSTSLGLERRGQTTYYPGAISDMNQSGSRFIKVTVAESNQNNTLTVVSDEPLPASNNALLVYRLAPAQDMKYMGRYRDSRRGVRREDTDEQHFTIFEIVQDVRRSR